MEKYFTISIVSLLAFWCEFFLFISVGACQTLLFMAVMVFTLFICFSMLIAISMTLNRKKQ